MIDQELKEYMKINRVSYKREMTKSYIELLREVHGVTSYLELVKLLKEADDKIMIPKSNKDYEFLSRSANNWTHFGGGC